ncbi:MAG: metallophosphoesterase [Bdellovibrionales bacterium]|nr:metallophosphoesterase [Bdellovibrionales bacterium]
MSNNQLLKFAFIFSALSFGICLLTYSLLKRRLKLEKKKSFWLLMTFTGIAILMISGPLAYRYGQASIENIGQQALQFAQYFLMGWVAMTLLTFFALEVVQSFLGILAIPFKGEKRIFLTEGVTKGLIAATSAATLGGYLQASAKPRIDKVEVKLPMLPKSFDGFTMTQISDVHIGPLLHKEFLSGVVDDILALDPDVILISGDLVDGTVEQLKQQVEPLRRLKAREGVYFCTGNHEYYSGAEEWLAHLEEMGIHTFRNSNTVFTRGNDKILLGGVYDFTGGRYLDSHISDPVKAAITGENVSCKILMAHNPFSTTVAATADWNYQVSGHTHAGQFYPFAFLVKLALKYSEGLYQVNDKMQLYVNRGTGFWGPPNRLGKPSEITHHILRST